MQPWLAISLGDLDRSFIAGFLEGEACLTISEQNGGDSFSCGCVVKLRDDDAALLEWLPAVTGVGRLRWVAAHATSRPQIEWRVDTQAECCELSDLIVSCGFHGRRAAELALWREAVEVWIGARGDRRRDRLRALKNRLHATRRYGAGARAAAAFERDAQRLGYISGLVSAEGWFGFGSRRPRFAIGLRGDDEPLLDLLSATTGLGAVYRWSPASPLNPSVRWIVTAASELHALIDLLCRGGLSGRKRNEMEAWAVAVDEICSARRGGVRPRGDVVERAMRELADLRVYRPPVRGELPRLEGRDLRAKSIDALRRWSETEPGALSCLAYSRWRQRSDPTRNTIARQFGSWHAALEVAGLGGRGAPAPFAAGGVERRVRERAAQRKRVVDAALECSRELGRTPRAMEFFRWRRIAAPGTPTQGTVYRLFPGGWAAVLDACGSAGDAQRSLKVAA